MGSRLLGHGHGRGPARDLGRALEIAPDCPRYLHLACLEQDLAPDDPLLGRIEALLAGPPLPRGEEVLLTFALGRQRHGQGAHEAAFRLWSRGNAVRKAEMGYDLSQDEAEFARARDIARAGFPRIDPPSLARRRPVFVTGLPRSGTTLAEQILASHPQVHGAGERALLGGQADAALYAEASMRDLAAERGAASGIEAVHPPFHVSQRAIGLRPGLATVRERLNAVIPGYLSSESYQVLRDTWLTPPAFWNADRLRQARNTAISAAALFGAAFVWLILRARRRALDQARRMEGLSNRLGAILDTARSGILALNRDGQIARPAPADGACWPRRRHGRRRRLRSARASARRGRSWRQPAFRRSPRSPPRHRKGRP